MLSFLALDTHPSVMESSVFVCTHPTLPGVNIMSLDGIWWCGLPPAMASGSMRYIQYRFYCGSGGLFHDLESLRAQVATLSPRVRQAYRFAQERRLADSIGIGYFTVLVVTKPALFRNELVTF